MVDSQALKQMKPDGWLPSLDVSYHLGDELTDDEGTAYIAIGESAHAGAIMNYWETPVVRKERVVKEAK